MAQPALACRAASRNVNRFKDDVLIAWPYHCKGNHDSTEKDTDALAAMPVPRLERRRLLLLTEASVASQTVAFQVRGGHTMP